MKYKRAKRYAMNTRTTKEMRDMIEAAAHESGRSLAQEIEIRLERTFTADWMVKEIKRALA